MSLGVILSVLVSVGQIYATESKVQIDPAEVLRTHEMKIARLEDKLSNMQRQMDRIEAKQDRLKEAYDAARKEGGDDHQYLLYVLCALLGIDKGSYWIGKRLNGRGRAKEVKASG